MLKKRLIFVLYYDAGAFYLSRNFRLQRVGDVRWLVDKFRFKSIGRFIDEIVILDVTREPRTGLSKDDRFGDALAYLMKETFVPLTIGGALRSLDDVKQCFQLGADKILFNTPVLTQADLVRECVAQFGAQAVIASIDIGIKDGAYLSRLENAQTPGLSLAEHLQRAIDLGVGEVMVNSIDQDGTGTGFDMELVRQCSGLPVPLIVAGGAGKPEHFADVLALHGVDAAATGNLFNFIGKGFERVRTHLLGQGLPVRSATL
jgi:imidazole glycerol-phosphate synthase subunit HisF